MYKANLLGLLMTFLSFASFGQTPFICKGDYYLTILSDRSSKLFTVDIDQVSNQVTFRRVPNFEDGYDLNAMGYRSTDNFIYLIDQTDNGLIRVGSDGRLVKLRVLSELPKLDYFAAACTPDGNYLVLSGSTQNFGFGSINVNLIFIDLRDPSYPTREVRLRDNPYLFYDMDFDPFTGLCYAYDSNLRTLIRIDIDRATTNAIGRVNQPCNTMGSLFFDAFGNLYGYGSPLPGDPQNTFYQINISTGDLQVRTTGEEGDGTDGCSCPYTIELEKTATPREAAPCSEVIYTFVIGNASATERSGVEFYDPMPEEFEILEVIRNPFGGDILDTGKPNELLIKNMVIPLGVDSLTVKVRIGQNSSGSYRNQAILSGLPESLGSSTVSDDPLTVALNDPTVIKVIPLTVDLQSQNRLVCEGDTLTLSGSQLGAQYLWQDGTTDISIDVTTPGTYYVEARTLCEVVYDTVVVEFSPPLTVELGEDRALTLGESFSIEPWVTGVGPYEYKWSESDERATIFCATCPEATITPFFDTRYRVAVTDAAGCIETDYINVVVDRSVYIWIPNAFSPNGDGVNDYFYVLGKYSYNIESFEIYNRWGQRIWQNNDILVNSEFDGWTGSAFGEMMTPDVYVYRAVLKFIDGSKQYFTGDVTLIR